MGTPTFLYDKQDLRTAVAGESMTAAVDYALIKLDTTANQVLLCGAKTEVAIGVLINKPASGAVAKYIPIKDGAILPMTAAAALATIGAEVTPTASAKIAANDATKGNAILGLTVDVSGADGDVIGVLVSKSQEPG